MSEPVEIERPSASAPRPETRTPTGALVLHGALVLLALQLSGLLLLGAWAAPQWFNLLVVLSGAALAFGLGIWRFSMGWAIYFLIVASLAAGLTIPGGEKLYPLLGDAVVDIGVDQAVLHPGVRRFEFNDAELLLGLSASKSIDSVTKGEFSRHRYHVVPVVAAGWDRLQPVQVWAVARQGANLSELASDASAGFRVHVERDRYHRAVSASASAHGLELEGEPLLLTVGGSLAELRRRNISELLTMLLVPFVCWIAVVVVVRSLEVEAADTSEPIEYGSARDFAQPIEGEWLSHDKVDQGLWQWLSGEQRVPEDVPYYRTSSSLASAGPLAGAVAVEICCLGLLAGLLFYGYENVRDQGLGLPTVILAFAVAGLAFLSFSYFPAAIAEERRRFRLHRTGRFRDGIYLLSTHLLYHLRGYSFFLARDSVEAIRPVAERFGEEPRLLIEYQGPDGNEAGPVATLVIDCRWENLQPERLITALEEWVRG